MNKCKYNITSEISICKWLTIVKNKFTCVCICINNNYVT